MTCTGFQVIRAQPSGPVQRSTELSRNGSTMGEDAFNGNAVPIVSSDAHFSLVFKRSEEQLWTRLPLNTFMLFPTF